MSETQIERQEIVCVICQEGFDDLIPARKCVLLSEEELRTLELCSVQRKDAGTLGRIIKCRISTVEVAIHTQCQKSYTDPERLTPSFSCNPPVLKKQRSSFSEMGKTGERRFFSKQSLILENVRLETFVNWECPHVKPEDMAANMLFSQRVEDHTRCYICAIFVGMWDAGDVPFQEHKKHSRDCSFCRHPDATGNVPIIGYDETVFENTVKSSDDPPRSEEDREKEKEVFKFINEYYAFFLSNTLPKPPTEIVGTDAVKVLEVKTPIAPYYGQLKCRHESYKDWPINVKSWQLLADAGFFSLGMADWVLCFYCGGGLYGWLDEHDPLHDHARFYPFCPFIKERLGEETVAKIATEFPAPKANDRSVKLTDEESELLMNHPMCRKIIRMDFNRNALKVVFTKRVEEYGFPYKDHLVLATATTDYQDSLLPLLRKARESEEQEKKQDDSKDSSQKDQSTTTSSSSESLVEEN